MRPLPFILSLAILGIFFERQNIIVLVRVTTKGVKMYSEVNILQLFSKTKDHCIGMRDTPKNYRQPKGLRL